MTASLRITPQAAFSDRTLGLSGEGTFEPLLPSGADGWKVPSFFAVAGSGCDATDTKT